MKCGTFRASRNGAVFVIQKILVSIAAIALVACSKSSEEHAATAPSSSKPTADAPAAGGDPCSLIPNADALIGEPVTAEHASMPNDTVSCHWKAADGRLCGNVTVFGPGWNEVPDVKANYVAMTSSLKAFGDTQDVSGIGEEAKAVDGGVLGAQLAFRTSTHLALVASGCKSDSQTAPALAEKLAREVATHL
jgi:hypothetical protein